MDNKSRNNISSFSWKRTNQKGVALILAMFTIVLVSYLAGELSYETNVEAIVNSQAVHRVKAYYAAKSGIDLALLRIKMYNQVSQQLPDSAKSVIKPELLEMIWSMPFNWPPTIGENAAEVEKDSMKEVVAESKMDANYITAISDEGSKLDVNDLNSPSKVIRDTISKQLIKIIEDKRQSDQKWAQMNADINAPELIHNIQDWVTPGRQSANGGDKGIKYSVLGPEYPPNRAFRTVQELRLVPGMNVDVFDLLKEHITVFGMKAINPNHATKEIFMSIDPTITSKIADDLIKRRDDPALGGKYKDAKDFWAYANSVGARITEELEKNIPISCDSAYNFRIESTGNVKNISVKITAIVFDLQKSASQIVKTMNSQSGPQQGNPNQSPQQQPANKQSPPPEKGPPRIVYWNEL